MKNRDIAEREPCSPILFSVQLVQSIYATTAKSPESFESFHVHFVHPHSALVGCALIVNLTTMNSSLCSLAIASNHCKANTEKN